MNGSETILCNLVHVNKKKMSDVKIRMKTHKLTLHCRNNDILHPEIKIVLKLGCQQTTRITNKTRDAIKKKKKKYR